MAAALPERCWPLDSVRIPAETLSLLEAGHAYAPDRFPAALLDASTIADPDYDWGYTSRGNDQNPQIPTPRGKVLGGNSAVNATVASTTAATACCRSGKEQTKS